MRVFHSRSHLGLGKELRDVLEVSTRGWQEHLDGDWLIVVDAAVHLAKRAFAEQLVGLDFTSRDSLRSDHIVIPKSVLAASSCFNGV